MAIPVSTGAIGIDASGTVQLYVPPGVVAVPPTVPEGAYSVEYGTWQNLSAGDTVAPGTWQVQGNSLEVIGTPTLVRSVTLIPLSSE